MKSKRIRILEKILKAMATAVLKRRRPIVIGITGSVGKTSAKEAVFCALSSKFNVRKNEKNYNNEIGIPLTIIGAETGGRSILKWAVVFLRWTQACFFEENYPEMIVVELGVDRPGDMKYLTSFTKPFVGIVTNVSGSHMEYFGSLEKISKEKGILVEKLPEKGFAILNADDSNVSRMLERTKASVITYGFTQESSIRALNFSYAYDDNGKPDGISLKVEGEGKSIPMRLRHILAPHQAYAVLSAIAVATAFKMNMLDAINSLQDFYSPPGRMNLIGGIKNSYIIDDTYNASPVSTLAALETFGKLGAKRKIAVLGDMLELGDEEENGHREVGKKIFEIKADFFIAVGDRMKKAVEEMVSLGFAKENIFVFDDPEKAARKLQEMMHEGDLVLIKGSQGMRMEKVVEEVMADPLNAQNILCRQNIEWKKKTFRKP